MTTASGLPAVRESLRLALLDAPYGGPVVVELAEAAVEHYALNYSRHVPAILFDEVHAALGLLGDALTAPADDVTGLEVNGSARSVRRIDRFQVAELGIDAGRDHVLAHDERVGLAVVAGEIDLRCLHGLLHQLRDIGLPLVSVRQVETDVESRPVHHPDTSITGA